MSGDEAVEPRATVNRRRLGAAAVAVLVVAGVAVGVSGLGPDAADTATDLTAEPLKTGTVTTGDLAVSDRLEGTLQRTSELVVVHRISGVTPGTGSVGNSNGSGLGTGAAASGAAPSGAGGAGLTAWFRPALVLQDPGAQDTGAQGGALVCGSTTTAASDPPTTTTSSAWASTTSPTDPPSSTTTDPLSTDPSVTVGPGPTTTAAPDGDPCGPAPTSTSAPTPSSSGAPGAGTPAGGLPTGGALPARGLGGGAGAGGGTGSGSSGAASAQAATPTEMVTSLLAAGTAVHSGDVVYSVEGRPVVALAGAVPAWRDLASGIDDGADIVQLEAALTALGYSDDGALTVDEAWDGHTTAAVKAWQTGLGLEATGEVPLGYVVFVPADTTVTAVNAAVGQKLADGDAVLRLATPSQEVVATVPAELRPVVAPGLSVEVSGVAATVTRLGSATGSDGTVDVVAYITPSGPITAADGSTVSARFTVTDAADVLLVPVDAVTSRIDGSYAVLAVDESGVAGTWVPIEVHGVGDGKVAATGDGLHEGLTVALPGDVASSSSAP